MSRIGKLPIVLPEKVSVSIDHQYIEVNGPHGKLSKTLAKSIQIVQENNEILVTTTNNSRQARELYGLSRTLINNMVLGVSTQFERHLKMKGTSYKASVSENKLTLNLGFSHPIILPFPPSISINV